MVLDLYSRRVVGWATSERLTDSLAHAALQRALTERHVGTDLVHHSDRGSQYTSASYQRLLLAHRLSVSMSRKGDCWDNAVVESFFATLKVELGGATLSLALLDSPGLRRKHPSTEIGMGSSPQFRGGFGRPSFVPRARA